MKRLKRILTAPQRALARAPRWVRGVWVLVAAVAVGLALAWAQDDANRRGYQQGFEAGAVTPAPAPTAAPQLPAWLPEGTDRVRAREAMREGLPFAVESHDEGFGCAARLLLMPDGHLWWLQHPETGGRELTWEVGRWGQPLVGCDSEKLPSKRGGGR